MSEGEDCEIIGKDYILIPDGEYEVSLKHWETSTRFARRDKSDSTRYIGGKLYLWFKVDPYNNTLEGENLIFLAQNVVEVTSPAGKGGKFKVGARSNYYKMLKRLFGSNVAKHTKSPSALNSKLLLARTRTVKTNEKQKKLHENEWYSVIDEIIDLA